MLAQQETRRPRETILNEGARQGLFPIRPFHRLAVAPSTAREGYVPRLTSTSVSFLGRGRPFFFLSSGRQQSIAVSHRALVALASYPECGSWYGQPRRDWWAAEGEGEKKKKENNNKHSALTRQPLIEVYLSERLSYFSTPYFFFLSRNLPLNKLSSNR